MDARQCSLSSVEYRSLRLQHSAGRLKDYLLQWICGYTMYDCAFDVKQLRKRRISGRERGEERSGGEVRGEEKGELECRTQLHNVPSSRLHQCTRSKAHATSTRLAFRLGALSPKQLARG